jgi:lipoyl(octanoyl) transferase
LPSPSAAAVWRFREPVAYSEAEALQEALVAQVAAGASGPLLLVLEHPLVVTLGRGADAAAAVGGPVPAVRTARGGSVTVHGPGQIVAYPIVDLRATGRSVHGFVRELEDWMIAAAAAVGVLAKRRDGLTGIWTARGKLGSIGIAVRRGITWHGLALYVADQQANFGALNPCALPGVAPDSLTAAVSDVDRGRVEDALIAAFAAALAPRACDIRDTDLVAASRAAAMAAIA